LIGILVILVLIIGSCFGIGITVICLLSFKTTTSVIVEVQKKHLQNKEIKKKGGQDAS